MTGWRSLDSQITRIRSVSEALTVLSLAGESMSEPNDGLAVIAFVDTIQARLEDIQAAINQSVDEWRAEGKQPKS